MAAHEYRTPRPRNSSIPPDPYGDDPWSWASVLFRTIEGWPRYGVDTLGDVWSCAQSRCWNRKRPTVRKSGHLFVGFRAADRHLCVGVHTLVLTAFSGPRPEGWCCRHLNGKPADNRLVNLKWGTYQENSDDAIRHGATARGERVGGARLDESKVSRIRQLRNQGRSLTSIAREFDVSLGNISWIVEGKTWSHVPSPDPETPAVEFRRGRFSRAEADEVLSMIARGFKQKDIAARFGVAQPSISRLIQRERKCSQEKN